MNLTENDDAIFVGSSFQHSGLVILDNGCDYLNL